MLTASATVAPLETITGPPTIDAAQIDAILASYDSPAVGTGQVWIDEGVVYGINPAYGVAFFMMESGFGTAAGWAGRKPDGTTTHNVGNIICAGYQACYERFRDYATWEDGISDWYRLISVEYVAEGLTTLPAIIAVYAPASDNNDEAAYVAAVEAQVQEWEDVSQEAVSAVSIPHGCPLAACGISGYGFDAVRHPGIDLAAQLGEPVYAVLDGIGVGATHEKAPALQEWRTGAEKAAVLCSAAAGA